ncbi:MAG: primosomal protein N' [Methylobacteriaceae bacterium]|nr:primosomal protein N' [Methylobacteriaceae bacterium]
MLLESVVERDEGREGAGLPLVADVLVPVALDNTYSYCVPAGLEIAPGDFVTVPLGTRETTGIVWSLKRSRSGGNLKEIAARRDLPRLDEKLMRFIDWVARYTLAPRGMVLRMVSRIPETDEGEAPRVGVRLAAEPRDGEPLRMTPARARVLKAADGGLSFRKSALAEAAACSTGVIDGLIDEGALETVLMAPEPVALPPDITFAEPNLSPAQADAADALRATIARGGFSTTLLEGVTGSGKTEVYFEGIAAALATGGQVLILMPEIALTGQFLDRFARRFGVRPAEWHSGVASRRRARIWSGAASSEVRVVAGARSALFLPFERLRLIIVDEEHEPAYKQEDGVTYHARDMAVVRGQIEGAAVVLASATPSIETRVNAAQRRYGHVELTRRHAGGALPDLAAIDLRRDGPPRGRWISPVLREAVGETIARNEQALLFLNRRGYAPLTVCRACGHRHQCPHCTAWLVEHRFRRALICHQCGHVERRPEMCVQCETPDSLAACGPGVERLAEEVALTFPDARTLVLSSDFPGGTERLRREIDAIARREFDIVIGTQLVAKGHNFPSLTLVGVIDADLGLSSGDPRAAERTFQLLNQVTGRAGRGDRPGRGLVQTYQPDHPVMKALLSGDAARFYAEETEVRLRAALPPFGRLAALIVSGADRLATEAHARALVRAAYSLPTEDGFAVAPVGGLPQASDILVLGPAEAPIAMVRGRYRFRILVKAPKRLDIQSFVRRTLFEAPAPRGGIRVDVDVDPQSFL